MGNSAGTYIEPSKWIKVTCESIEFEKIWTHEEKYKLSKLVLKVSMVDMVILVGRWYYYDLIGDNTKLVTSSIIKSCDFKRADGTVHTMRFLGGFDAEIRPKDEVIFKRSFRDSITVMVENKEDLGKYIKNPEESSQYVSYLNSFKHKHVFTSSDQTLKLEVTKDRYARFSENGEQWTDYTITIPKSMISRAMKCAEVASKPGIIEKYFEGSTVKIYILLYTYVTILYSDSISNSNTITAHSTQPTQPTLLKQPTYNIHHKNNRPIPLIIILFD